MAEATLADVPAERIAESLAFINWTVLTALGAGTFGAVVAGRFRTEATRGYLAFTAFCAAAFAALAAIADAGLPALSSELARSTIDPSQADDREATMRRIAVMVD